MLAEEHRERLERLFLQKGNPLSGLRKRAWDKALELGFPDRNHESFKKVSLKPLFELDFQEQENGSVDSSLYQREGFDHVVIVDGKHRADLSSKIDPAILLSIEEGMQNYGIILQNRMMQNIQKGSNVFSLFSEALQDSGLFLYIPPKKQLARPIQILQLYTKGNTYSVPRVQIFVGNESEVTILSEQIFLEKNEIAVNGLVDCVLERNAKCKMVDLSLNNHKNLFMQQVQASVKRDAFFQHISVTKGSPLYKRDFFVELLEERAECDLSGGWLLDENNRAHTDIRIEHRAEHTHSNQFFKGVLKGKSRSSFEGKIYVTPEAQKTEAYQLNNNLILDEGASAFSKPNLEIFADDVKASHGATISQLDDEELFYLRSRGISRDLAMRSLTDGFISPIINKVPFESLRGELK